jgi:hypothetical protein
MKSLKDYQVHQLNEHLSKHSYYLGQMGIQLTGSDLEQDFMQTYFNQVAHDMRLTFCNDECPIKECKLRDLFNKKG